MPYFVLTVVPSTIGRMSRCTPSRLTSGPWPPSRPAILSISSMKMMPACSTRSTAVARDAVHVDQLLLFFLREVLERLGHLHPPLLRLALEEARQHVLEVDVDFLDRRPGDDLERGKRFLADVDLDDARVEAAGAQLLAEPLARLAAADRAAPRPDPRPGADRPRRRQQQVEQPLLGVLRRLAAHLLEPLVAHHVDAELDQVAHHRLDVAADVADLGELRRLDLDERRLREPRQPARDLGLADAGRPDHQDVLRRDLLGQLGRAASGGACGCAARSRRRAWRPPGR